jgi:hypothetical protein
MLAPQRRTPVPPPDGTFAAPSPNDVTMDPQHYVFPSGPDTDDHEALEDDVAALKRELAELRAVVKYVASALPARGEREAAHEGLREPAHAAGAKKALRAR